MMKRFGYLYEKIYDLDNIRRAHLNARKGKRHYREVKMIDANPDKYFQIIQDVLKNKTFQNSKYRIVTKKTDNGKVRKIYKLPYFPDRIIHHCIMQVLEPIWYPTLIRDTYSAIKGRGIHDGVNRIKNALRDKNNTRYCLKMDVSKFYPSVNNTVLKHIIRKKIKDNDILWLLDTIIDSIPGLPIGNYLSQYFGNLYLSELDHLAKEKLDIKYYYRYCDDIVILSGSKEKLHGVRQEFEMFLNEVLKLKLKDNWQIYPISSRGIDFLGYRFFHGYILLRKSIASRFKSKMLYIKNNWEKMTFHQVVNSVMSYWGWLKYANTRNLINRYMDADLFWIVKQTALMNRKFNPLQGAF